MKCFLKNFGIPLSLLAMLQACSQDLGLGKKSVAPSAPKNLSSAPGALPNDPSGSSTPGGRPVNGAINVENSSCRPKVAAYFCGGNGEQGSPFLVCTANQLDAIRGDFESCHFKLNNDIDLSVLPADASGTNFHSIVAVQGFDGGGHRVSNLVLHKDVVSSSPDSTNYQPVGFFVHGALNHGSYIKDLRLENVDIQVAASSLPTTLAGSNFFLVGALAAETWVGRVENVKATGSVLVTVDDLNTRAINGYVGGLIGIGGGCYSCETNVNVEVKIGQVGHPYSGGVVYVGGLAGGVQGGIFSQSPQSVVGSTSAGSILVSLPINLTQLFAGRLIGRSIRTPVVGSSSGSTLSANITYPAGALGGLIGSFE
jgi:hypothetical protein